MPRTAAIAAPGFSDKIPTMNQPRQLWMVLLFFGPVLIGFVIWLIMFLRGAFQS
jgi:hypothetical protein